MGNVHIPRWMELEIELLRKENKHNMSVPDFVREAVREKLERMGVEVGR